ncbi:hypothetical protein FACS1894147_10490 [Spirochaetia bacterium]|nr:hypothetical protein FACS1894147_10490 [Spirochaetia bacterium]
MALQKKAMACKIKALAYKTEATASRKENTMSNDFIPAPEGEFLDFASTFNRVI